MGFIKIVNKPYDTKESLNNLIYYIANYSEFIGGCGISVLSLESVISEFETIKKVFNKAEEGRRQVRHFIISFRYGEMNIEFIKKIAWEMAKYYGNKFQVFYGIHLNTDTPHIVYCKIELPKVAKQNRRMLHLQIGECCKHLSEALRNGAAPEW